MPSHACAAVSSSGVAPASRRDELTPHPGGPSARPSARHPARERDQLATRGIRLGIRFRSAGSHPLGPDSDLRHDRQGSASHPDSGVRVHDVITLSSSTHRWATPPGTPSRPSSASVTPTHLPVVSHGVVQHPPERRTIRDSRLPSSTADLTYVHTRHHLSLVPGEVRTRRDG